MPFAVQIHNALMQNRCTDLLKFLGVCRRARSVIRRRKILDNRAIGIIPIGIIPNTDYRYNDWLIIVALELESNEFKLFEEASNRIIP